MSDTDSTPESQIDGDGTEGGLHGQFESVTYSFGDDADPDDDRTPADRINADVAPETGPIRHRTTGARLVFPHPAGTDTELGRIEIYLDNPTDASITDTIAVDPADVLPMPTTGDTEVPTASLWPDDPPDNGGTATPRAGRETEITLGAGNSTVLAVSGDGRTSHPAYTEAGARVPGSLPLQPGTETVVEATSQNATDGDSTTAGLTIEETWAFVYPTEWTTELMGTGALRTRGPDDRVRRIGHPGERGYRFPEGIRVGADDPQLLRKLVSGTAIGRNRDYNGDGNGLRLRERSDEPLDPQSGDIELADGSGWDPGDGQGPYVYTDAGAWVALFVDTNVYTPDEDGLEHPVLSSVPANPVIGATYYADGSGWDPGSGEGTYEYTASSGFRPLF